MTAQRTSRRKAAGRAHPGARSAGRLQRALDEAATREIKGALAEAKGNVTEAATLLGVHRVSLMKRMARLGIRPYEFAK